MRGMNDRFSATNVAWSDARRVLRRARLTGRCDAPVGMSVKPRADWRSGSSHMKARHGHPPQLPRPLSITRLARSWMQPVMDPGPVDPLLFQSHLGPEDVANEVGVELVFGRSQASQRRGCGPVVGRPAFAVGQERL